MDFKMKRNLFLPEGDDFSKNYVDMVAEEIYFDGRNKLDKLREGSRNYIKSEQKLQNESKIKTNPKAEGEKKTYKELLQEMMKKR